ncbi:hypothetical protein I4U23_021543 [Adineta vaga]|nr:hypothetical protein I4U23_021543 [Adineta vaga]
MSSAGANQETEGGTFKNVIDDPATKPQSHEYAEQGKEKCCPGGSCQKPCGTDNKTCASNECCENNWIITMMNVLYNRLLRLLCKEEGNRTKWKLFRNSLILQVSQSSNSN